MAEPEDSVTHGYVCGTCGLSDIGLTRLRSFGFDKRGCIHCRDHFDLTAAGAPQRLCGHLNPTKESL